MIKGFIQRKSMFTTAVIVAGLASVIVYMALDDVATLIRPLRVVDFALGLGVLFNFALVFDNCRHNGGRMFSSHALMHWVRSESGLKYILFQVIVLTFPLAHETTLATDVIIYCFVISVALWVGAPPVAIVLACSGPNGSRLAAFVRGVLYPLRSIHLLDTGSSIGHPDHYRVSRGTNWRNAVRYFEKEVRFILVDVRSLCDGVLEEVLELLGQEGLRNKTLFIIDSEDGRAILLDKAVNMQPHLSISPSSKVTMLGAGVRIARELAFAESLWRPWAESLDPKTGLYR